MAEALLMNVKELASLLADDDVLVIDCRFNLMARDAGRQGWVEGHIPGAVYAHLDDDLAAPVGPATGRHPLPTSEAFAGFLAKVGWTENTAIVAYDEQGGAMAARLWWLMRYFGHDVVRLLDGGLSVWRQAGFGLETGDRTIPATAPPSLVPAPAMVRDQQAVKQGLADGSMRLLDARAPDRYAGQNETIDPVAGHVPGAENAPFAENLAASGRFVSASESADRFASLLAGSDPESVVHMCGSGVTACHNLFAMEYAGMTGSRLYPGSWSEWIRNRDNSVATGPDPSHR